MAGDVKAKPSPQKLHNGTGAVFGIDARAPQFKNFARVRNQTRNIVFRAGIKTAALVGGVAADQAVCPDDGVLVLSRMVEKQKVVADFVVLVEVAFQAFHLGRRLGAHFLIKSFIAKLLRLFDFGGRLSKANLKAAQARIGACALIERVYGCCQKKSPNGAYRRKRDTVLARYRIL